jgi:hypothetical protein
MLTLAEEERDAEIFATHSGATFQLSQCSRRKRKAIDCLTAKLRPGNSAEGWKELLLPEIERQQQQGRG